MEQKFSRVINQEKTIDRNENGSLIIEKATIEKIESIIINCRAPGATNQDYRDAPIIVEKLQSILAIAFAKGSRSPFEVKLEPMQRKETVDSHIQKSEQEMGSATRRTNRP